GQDGFAEDLRFEKPEEVSAMSKRLVVSIVAVLAAGMFSPLLRAQDEKWNEIPPKRAANNGKKPNGPAPRRDLTGIWDAAQPTGVSGATEHPALFPGGRGQEGGREDETGDAKPLPYTPAGLEALKTTKPSDQGVRPVDSVRTNDTAGQWAVVG